ncbi:hypothetical protein EV586_103420 [Tumebacillus sp. BK434]|uniref:type I-A CRISPR-associated protein Cas5 n=1 Tax=Tumebacillus sp. BK434 TaxID=2512169 RepID=UPI0010440432|nr:type I-A CRISPR-associated protein Cas5 [Tumebacillus sp. BK434]TCP55766.1 hypothetical protein EV586_103420 [Tumebacillus sp. BK434]
MWLLTTYRHTALFSLRSSMATSSGGKTNLVPSMYSVKMAILDASFRMGLDGADIFPWVRDLEIRFEPPAHAVVNNSFIKVLSEPKTKDPEGLPFISSVGYREFVSFEGDLCIAICVDGLEGDKLSTLKSILLHINYLGKRGSFVQVVEQEMQDELRHTFSVVLGERSTTSSVVMVQYLDDMGATATFESINSYSDVKNTLGRDRVMRIVFLPYRIKSSSRGYTVYSR